MHFQQEAVLKIREKGWMQGIRNAKTGMYTRVHEGFDNVVAVQANLRKAEVKRSGRSQYRATPQTPFAAIFMAASRLPWNSAPARCACAGTCRTPCRCCGSACAPWGSPRRSEEHTSELQSPKDI